MSYVVEQKIKGRIYLYEVESFWDKDKKQARQRRKYLGPKEKVYKKSTPAEKDSNLQANSSSPSSFISKSYGDVFLINYLQEQLKLTDILKNEFGEDYKEILALSAFMLQESSPSYMFPYWHEEHCFEDVKKLNSQNISNIYEYIGRHERERFNFLTHL